MRKLLNYFKYEMISINFYFTIMTKVALQSVSLFLVYPGVRTKKGKLFRGTGFHEK